MESPRRVRRPTRQASDTFRAMNCMALVKARQLASWMDGGARQSRRVPSRGKLNRQFASLTGDAFARIASPPFGRGQLRKVLLLELGEAPPPGGDLMT